VDKTKWYLVIAVFALCVVVAILATVALMASTDSDSTDVGLSFEASKATTTTVTATPINLSQVDVKNYGAVGDGTADDTNAIVSANNAAVTNGAILFFPQGTYYVADPTRLPYWWPLTTWKGTTEGSFIKTQVAGENGDINWDFRWVEP
jgi:hypothetical protein